jgi:hypothetical protein
MLFLFFTLPMLGIPFIGLFVKNGNPNFWNGLMVSFFTIPIGLLPLHLLIDGFVAVRYTESSIIFKKYFGFWKKEYNYNDLLAYSRDSYQRSKGSSKRYNVLNVLLSDGKVYRIDEGNIANYQQICKQIHIKSEMKEQETLIHDDNGLFIWLFYVLVATIGIVTMFFISKLSVFFTT